MMVQTNSLPPSIRSQWIKSYYNLFNSGTIPCFDKYLSFFQYFNILSYNIVFVTVPGVCVKKLQVLSCMVKISTFSLPESPLTQITLKNCVLMDWLIQHFYYCILCDKRYSLWYWLLHELKDVPIKFWN